MGSFKSLYRQLILHRVPVNLSYAWNAGSMALVCLVSQIFTGLLLTVYYVPSIEYAFISVEFIMRKVESGWWVRYMHANGASIFFFVVYLHIMRGLYFGSYRAPREHVWASGVTMFLLMMLIAFMGYVLPWGQMSFWAAAVITGFLDVIPLYGVEFWFYLIGGEFLNTSTLLRFYTMHYILPFVLFSLVIVHVMLLHESGSNNPMGTETKWDFVSFHWSYTIKDLLGVWLLLFIGCVLIHFYPNVLLHPDNYIAASKKCTPPHIVPEWYFLFFYGLLRSVPDREGGVVAVIVFIAISYLLPCIHNLPVFFVNEEYSGFFKPTFQVVFWYFVVVCVLLGWVGGKEQISPYLQSGRIFGLLLLWFLVFFLFDTQETDFSGDLEIMENAGIAANIEEIFEDFANVVIVFYRNVLNFLTINYWLALGLVSFYLRLVWLNSAFLQSIKPRVGYCMYKGTFGCRLWNTNTCKCTGV